MPAWAINFQPRKLMDVHKSLIALGGLALAVLTACAAKGRLVIQPRITRYRATIGDDLETHEIDFRAASPEEALAYAKSRVYSPSEMVEELVDLNTSSTVYRYGIGYTLPEKR